MIALNLTNLVAKMFSYQWSLPIHKNTNNKFPKGSCVFFKKKNISSMCMNINYVIVQCEPIQNITFEGFHFNLCIGKYHFLRCNKPIFCFFLLLQVLTKDSVTVSVDAVVYYRVSNATVSVANVENAHHSTRLLAQTTLRNILGTKNLHEILSDRESISGSMQVCNVLTIFKFNIIVFRCIF